MCVQFILSSIIYHRLYLGKMAVCRKGNIVKIFLNFDFITR